MADLWTIERLVPGGEGFLRLPDGRAGFAPGTAPGDQIRVRVAEDHGGYVRARQWDLVTPSSVRVAPPCPIARACGGCDLMHLARPAQLAAKRSMLVEALQRTAKIPTPEVAPKVVVAPPDLGYRHRARLHVARTGHIGFRARRSHDVIELAHCAVCSDAVNAAIKWVTRTPAAILRELSVLEIREDLGGGPTRVLVEPRSKPSPHLREWAQQPAESLVVELPGTCPPTQRRFPLPGGLQLFVGNHSFTQVHWGVNWALIDHLLAGARERGLQRFCELYCGSGNFTLPLLAAGMRGRAIELDAGAIAAAQRGAEAAGLPPETFAAGDAVDAARRFAQIGERFDWLLVDPPRGGARQLVEHLPDLGADTVAICSCDPVTLARDVRTLMAKSFRLEQVTAFDMFPQTHHLEAIAWLQR